VPPADVPSTDLAELAAGVARQAGALLLEGRDAPRTMVETKSSPTDMVTEMDGAAERLIRAALRSARPDDAILGEEQGEGSGSSGVRWIVDPLDGTTNYLYGFPIWSVSIAAQVHGEVIAAVVLDPERDELFSARLGQGATCNGRHLRVTGPPQLDTALVGTGFAYDRDRRGVQASWLPLILPRIRDIRRAGSAALDLCWVAAGRLDAYYEMGVRLWDFAAGALIAAEAGAWVGGFGGGPAIDGASSEGAGVIAACPQLAEPLRALIAAAAAAAPPQP
jgi:myo-inositol-1(or 4)-monophosphatase